MNTKVMERQGNMAKNNAVQVKGPLYSVMSTPEVFKVGEWKYLAPHSLSETFSWRQKSTSLWPAERADELPNLPNFGLFTVINVDTETRYLTDAGSKWIGTSSKAGSLASGPHINVGTSLRPVFRVYDDSHSTFLHALGQDTSGNFYPLRVGGDGLDELSVAVPSRMASGAMGDAQRMSGWRIAVKDIFQIKGIPTSVCNKAYFDLYSDKVPSQTAACVELLTNLGAVIVGTTKLASFAATEEPSPAGSSSGSGAAIGAYVWLDIAIGSDTSGSGRRPGHWNGCIAMRPTHGVLPYEGYIPSFRRFDVPTFFGRDLVKCERFARLWYGEALNPVIESGRLAIIYPTDYMSIITNKVQLAIIDDFVHDLETYMGIRHEKVSFNELWSISPPKAAGNLSLEDYMKDVSRNSFFYDDYHNFESFRDEYTQRYERDVAVDKLETYKEWFLDVAMKRGKRDTLVLIPIENISPRYRDDPPLAHFNPVGVPNLFLSPILGAPELTIPIGTTPYDSKVTGQTEKLPIGISILGEPGRDMELFDIAYNCLKQAGRPTSVKAGYEMF
ncbi:amidase signature domain-containing protein [Diaporthe sp. PMI_573]|nr:amidase signature domain-containing protein [Diaporthaceae sp. PMI_573]